jgi:hypothetical protein
VEVANVQVDTLKQKMFDIKDIRGSRVRWATGGNIYYYCVIGIGALVYWFVKTKEKKLRRSI